MTKQNTNGKTVFLDYEKMFDVIMRTTEDSIFFKDRDSRFIYVSDAQLRHLKETDVKNVIGKTDFDFFSKEHAERTIVCEQGVMKTGIAVIGTEEYAVFKDGSKQWNKLSNYPLYDNEHNIIGTWGISTDITAQKEAEYRLKEREEHYRILADVTIEGILIYDEKIKDVNTSLLDLLGHSREEVIGHDPLEYVYKNDRSLVIENTERDIESPYEIRLCKKDGTVFFAEVESRNIKLPGTRLRMAAVRDITMRKEAKEALIESEARMRAITDSAHDAILMMDPGGRISYWNPAAERIFGYTEDEAMGKDLHQLIMPERYNKEYKQAFTMFKKTGRGNAVGKMVDMEGKKKDGTEMPIQLSLSAVRLNNGWNSVGIIRDTTQQKQNEREIVKAKELAEEATNAKSNFLANMSHEIRTPMNAIIGFSGLLKTTQMTSKQQDYINKIETSAQSLLGIINDILDFSKIEAGKLDLESVDFRLDEVIENIVGMNAEKASQKNVELLNTMGKDVPLNLVGDPLRIGQILLNLVNNAVKFTETGHILVRTEMIHKKGRDCKIQFSVEDTGIGMTKEQKNKLFSAFSQADSSVTRRFGGTGLGLAISKQLVDMMNGEISVESEFGMGSTFSFVLELKVQEGKNTRTSHKKSIKGLRALIVDDNELSREILKSQMELFDIRAATVNSGKEAIDEILSKDESDPYDLVFMDWRMPAMNGIEAAKQIMKNHGLAHMPKIVMLSAFGREDVIKQARKIGINAFLIKPVNQSLLFDTIMDVSGFDGKDIAFSGLEANKSGDGEDITGVKILLAEDNVLNQEVAKEILEHAGASVDIVNNGKEAVDAVFSSVYDAVLMDIQMPVMGGYEATKNIRANEMYKDLPIIAMTAHAMQGVKEECIAAGMDDYVSKPIETRQLFSVIKKWTKPKTAGVKRKIGDEKRRAPEKEAALPKSGFGVDIESGLERLNGNEKLYWKILSDFDQNYLAYADRIKKEIEKGNKEEAMRLAHTLKGVAGNISANDIYNYTVELEKTFRNDIAGKGEVLLEKLQSALDAFHVLLEGTEEKKKPKRASRAARPGEAAQGLRELAVLVWEDNVDAMQAMEKLREIVDDEKLSADMNRLASSIDEFDFESAKALLKKIAEEMNVDLGGTIK